MGRKRRAAEAYEDDFLVSASSPATNARTWHADGDLWAEPPTHRNSCSRFIVVVTSVVLVLGGIGVAVLGRVEQDKKIFPLCPKCDSIVTMMYIAGATVACIGALGLVAAATRMRAVAVVNTILLVLVTLLLVVAGSAVAVYYSGVRRDDLKTLWKDAVRDDPAVICDLQSGLECSGFDKCCDLAPITAPPAVAAAVIVHSQAEEKRRALDMGASGATNLQSDDEIAVGAPNSTVPMTTFPASNVCGITAQDYADQCASHCDSNALHRTTCSSRAETDLKQHLVVILVAVFGSAVVLAITAVASIRMTMKS